MKKKYKSKSIGYITVLRDFQKLLLIKGVNFSVLGAYMCFVFHADWCKWHENYRAILPVDTELSMFWRCNSSTVTRNRKKLIELGLLEEIDGNTYIKNYDIFTINTVKVIIKSKMDNSHEYYAKTEEDMAKMLMGIEEMQVD